MTLHPFIEIIIILLQIEYKTLYPINRINRAEKKAFYEEFNQISAMYRNNEHNKP